MKRSAPPRETAKLSDSIHHQLNMYASAASAAGVGLLALAQSVEAKIVYTPAHHKISPNSVFPLDLNHDGIADFILKDTHNTSGYSASGRLSVLPVGAGQKNQIWGHTALRRAYASALFGGVRVGPKGQFLPAAGTMAVTQFSGGIGYCTGPWGYVTNRYLGLKFVIAGKVHFGWARLNVTCPWNTFTVIGVLTGYAYETVSNRAIVTGKKKGGEDFDNLSGESRNAPGSAAVEPAGLGRLAQGATGLAVWRSKQ